MTRPVSRVLALSIGLALTALLASSGQVRGTDPIGKAIDWQPGVCAAIAEGDTLTMEWNPAFDTSVDIIGLQEMRLHLSKRRTETQGRQPGTGFDLFFLETRVRAGEGTSSVKPMPNGFYQVSFRARLRHVEPGEYYVVAARASAATEHSSNGHPPQMTNKPSRLPYCVTVGSPATPERTAR